MSALTKGQKSYLAQQAQRAWVMSRDKFVAASGLGVDDFPDAEDWRHAEVVKACGKAGLRCCDQRDYALVKGHFLDLLGATGQAFKAQVRASTEGRRQAEAVLVRECARAGVGLAYAEAICRRQYRCGLFDAGEKQIWSLVYTVRNRAAAKRKKGVVK